MKLMGVDVGFSKSGETTGIVCLDGDKLYLSRAGTSWEKRKARIPASFQPNVIAVDGPLLPKGADELVRRKCEFVFIRAPFWNRCKPGLSHSGTGLELRRAAADAMAQFTQVLADSTLPRREAFISRGGPIVEAFPNAFLAVLLPEEEFRSAPKLRRGQRFDWLYERAVRNERLKFILSKGLDLPDEVWRRLSAETDHELRAALVCLLTAAFAAQGSASIVGDAESGWFWLPPSSLWQGWAKDGLSSAEEKFSLSVSLQTRRS
jgi:predicted nuclease with RNAse H fold